MHANREGAEQVLPRKASQILIRTVLKGYLRHIPSTEVRDFRRNGPRRVTCTNYMYLHHNFSHRRRQVLIAKLPIHPVSQRNPAHGTGDIFRSTRGPTVILGCVNTCNYHTSLSCKRASCYEAAATDHARTLSLPIWERGGQVQALPWASKYHNSATVIIGRILRIPHDNLQCGAISLKSTKLFIKKATPYLLTTCSCYWGLYLFT